MASEKKVGPPLQIIEFGRAGVRTLKGPPTPGEKEDHAAELSNVSLVEQSADGRLIATLIGDEIVITKAADGSIQTKIAKQTRTKLVNFSPKGKYLLTFEYMQKAEAGAAPAHNLNLWNTTNGENVHSWVHKTYTSGNWPVIKWSDDEQYASRIVATEILIYSNSLFATPASRIKIEGVTTLEWAPSKGGYKLCAFVAEKKGQPASFRMYEANSSQRIGMQTCYKAQEGAIFWNSLGTAAILTTQTDVDTTGKSYYGETGMFVMSVDGECRNVRTSLEKEGPIYSHQWSPSGEKFVVVYGSMPSLATLFNIKLEKLMNFPNQHRNTALFSPHGHTLAIAGFGNLQGHIDIWDVKRGRLIDSFQAPCTVTCEWSPCSTYILTATVTPRLRIDNGWKIWKTDGTVLYDHPVDELYSVQWRKADSDLYPSIAPKNFESSIQKQKQHIAATAKGKYIPPAARLAAAAAAAAAPAPVVAPVVAVKFNNNSPVASAAAGNASSAGNSKNAARNKKRREMKKQQQPATTTAPAATTEKSAAPAGENSEAGGETEAQKKIKGINKKLRQIDQLKEQQKQGKQLNKDQQGKLASEVELRQQLADLSKQ